MLVIISFAFFVSFLQIDHKLSIFFRPALFRSNKQVKSEKIIFNRSLLYSGFVGLIISILYYIFMFCIFKL